MPTANRTITGIIIAFLPNSIYIIAIIKHFVLYVNKTKCFIYTS